MTQSTAAPVLDAAHLESRLQRIRAAISACPTEVPAGAARRAHDGLDEVAERLALGVDHTVVALLGGTGSGKSSLFNALTQLEFADVGARRPTTSRAAACSWGDDACALLDFLGVTDERRIRRESLLDASDQDELAGLVLLDVPDYDSVTTAHALQVDRLVPLADVLVWVVDPQKYADAALHEGYLRRLGARQEDMLVLVNQIDTLPEGGREALLRDVRSLLDADGLREVRVMAVSASRGDNLAEVRELLTSRVARESNAARTASARLDDIARNLAPHVSETPVSTVPELDGAAVEGLERASGALAVRQSIQDALSGVLPRSLARPEPPSRAAVVAVETTWLRRTTEGLPQVWLRSVEDAVASSDRLGAQAAEAVGGVPLPGHRSPVVELLWWTGLLALLIGVIWGAASAVGGSLSAAAIGVAVVGLVLAVTAHLLRRRRAVEEAERYGRRVHQRLSAVVSRALTEPAAAVLERHARLREALQVEGA